MTEAAWSVDPEDPRAPPQEVWERLTPAERDRLVASLPTDMPLDGMVAELVEARDAALRQAEDEAKRAEDEAKRAEALATENEALRAELERLRRLR